MSNTKLVKRGEKRANSYKMGHPYLDNYIKEALSKGIKENEIEKTLISRGWGKIEVNRAILDAKFGDDYSADISNTGIMAQPADDANKVQEPVGDHSFDYPNPINTAQQINVADNKVQEQRKDFSPDNINAARVQDANAQNNNLQQPSGDNSSNYSSSATKAQSLNNSDNRIYEKGKKPSKLVLIIVGATVLLIIVILITIIFKSGHDNTQIIQNNPVDITTQQQAAEVPVSAELLQWCIMNSTWSDPVVKSNEPLIIQDIAIMGNKTYCRAATISAPNLGYRFSENNAEIYKLEERFLTGNSSQKFITLIKIKPPVQQSPPRLNLSWCIANSIWTDPSIINSTEPIIVRGPIRFGENITACYASTNTEKSLGYRFTENNAQIWKNEESVPVGNSTRKLIIPVLIKQ
jgi:hypothetical protein